MRPHRRVVHRLRRDDRPADGVLREQLTEVAGLVRRRESSRRTTTATARPAPGRRSSPGASARPLPPGPPRIDETTMQPKLWPIRWTLASHALLQVVDELVCMPCSPTVRARCFISQNDTWRRPASTPLLIELAETERLADAGDAVRRARPPAGRAAHRPDPAARRRRRLPRIRPRARARDTPSTTSSGSTRAPGFCSKASKITWSGARTLALPPKWLDRRLEQRLDGIGARPSRTSLGDRATPRPTAGSASAGR